LSIHDKLKGRRAMSLDERIARLKNKRLNTDLFQWPRVPVLYRQLSANEQASRGERKKDIFKCVHGKHYFTPCNSCGRTQRIADKWVVHYTQRQAKLRDYLDIT
jgi:hypothetical protein